MPFSATSNPPVLGIDAGATLCKIAYLRGKSIVTHSLPSGDTQGIGDYIARTGGARVIASGGGAARLAAELPHLRIQVVGEFASWVQGAPVLAQRMGLGLPEHLLLVSLGTGTSVLRLGGPDGQPLRVGGSALGGGTLIGLGRLLLGALDFESLCARAARGDRRGVDLLVGDIYRDPDSPLPHELNAASFGKLDSVAPDDLAHALMALVGENIALITGQLGLRFGIRDVCFCGSTLTGNPALADTLSLVAQLHGQSAHFLELGAFCGAVGAAVSGVEAPSAPRAS